MDTEHFERLNKSLNRVAAAVLAASMLSTLGRKPSLKDAQTVFNDCCMIVDPEPGTEKQNDFQSRLERREWESN